ncbi:MAG: DUF938 domain-containing protein [Sphingomonadales bacterium]|nr:DUF938 domain-containing protein [Sphingomonadales bacterium]NCQ21828.1 DUF938 domain-containing protein [Sphingomonadales bacterium]NCT04540.1 DUF938 domain-containing protein [Sphingomonadales bacterium]
MAKQHAPATQRNRDAITDVLAHTLPASGAVLEIAAGTGEHAVFFAGAFPHLGWHPTDPSHDAVASIAAYREDYAGDNLAAPLILDAAEPGTWPVAKVRAFDACVCINMIHISVWDATIGLFEGCARVLTQAAPLILYGPYLEADVETTASNLEFDQSLKMRNPAWGLRQLHDVDSVASDHGFARVGRYQMPANNLMLVYRKRSS